MHLKRFLPLLVLIALLLPAASDPPPTPAPAEVEAELAEAFAQRLEAGPEMKSLAMELFTPEVNAAFISPDEETAVLWLALRDDAGRTLATEPGLALARRSETGWQVLLPGDSGWGEMLVALPDGMLPLEHSPAPQTVESSAGLSAALTGYYLPYAAGTARWLEGSISHFQYVPELGYPSCSIDTCRYAYDFTDRDHFPLLASKEGTVYASRDRCPDGSTTCTNYIVLRDTNGLTYQIYLHLAHGTIPDKLSPGTFVRRGQYIGDSDDTGYSTSQHVHFMVVDDIWKGGGNNDYYWGRSVDIRFADVAINNGIPRNCYEVTRFPIYNGATECLGNKADPRNPANDWYVSGNVGAYPPEGALSRPAAGETVAGGPEPEIKVSATASDDVRVTAVRLVAKVDGEWVETGPKVTQPVQPGLYEWGIDLCAAGLLHGPVEVALRAWDHEGNVSAALGPRTIQIDHACPPPTSQLRRAETFDSTAVRLNWTADGTAGIGSFELQWRSEPGSWKITQTLTLPGSQRSIWFSGQPGETYAFRLRALDANGQAEAWPSGGAAETITRLPATCTADTFEPDDEPDQARSLALGERAQRNLCGPGDPDWFRLEIESAGIYVVGASSLNGGAAVRITIYAEDGTTILAKEESTGLGRGARALFQPAAPGSYYFKVEPLTANLFGTGASYRVMVADAGKTYLPLVRR